MFGSWSIKTSCISIVRIRCSNCFEVWLRRSTNKSQRSQRHLREGDPILFLLGSDARAKHCKLLWIEIITIIYSFECLSDVMLIAFVYVSLTAEVVFNLSPAITITNYCLIAETFDELVILGDSDREDDRAVVPEVVLRRRLTRCQHLRHLIILVIIIFLVDFNLRVD